MNKELYDDVENVFQILTKIATGGSYDDEQTSNIYKEIRLRLIKNGRLDSLLPSFIKIYRDLPAFWGFIKNQEATYAARRSFLAEQFKSLFDYLEKDINIGVIDDVVNQAAYISSEYVRDVWRKAIIRREQDPEGAITAARTLLEATCKYILGQSKISYNEKADLGDLYKLTAKQLKLAPDDYTEQVFKQILGSAASIVNGLGSLRNKISDAHAIANKRARPLPRHAMLCVNLAGSVAEFLIMTFEEKFLKTSQ